MKNVLFLTWKAEKSTLMSRLVARKEGVVVSGGMPSSKGTTETQPARENNEMHIKIVINIRHNNVIATQQYNIRKSDLQLHLQNRETTKRQINKSHI